MIKTKIVYYNVKVELSIEQDKKFDVSFRVKTLSDLGNVPQKIKEIIEHEYPEYISLEILLIDKIVIPCFSDKE